jgi:hypothetical protein
MNFVRLHPETMRMLIIFSRHRNVSCTTQQFTNHRRLQKQPAAIKSRPTRILYIVTSMNEYDTGRRSTTKGYDRFQNTILPVLQESMTSIWQWLLQQQQLSNQPSATRQPHLHLYFVAHYNVTRIDLLQQLIQRVKYSSSVSHPESLITFDVWHEATPLGYAYDNNKSPDRISEITRGLARQQRYIVKDLLEDYDMVVAFEDDMLVHGSALEHYWTWTQKLYQGRHGATKEANYTVQEALTRFHGDMTLIQWQRMIPGFMRVEAPLADFVPTTNNLYSQIPLNYSWDDRTERHIDPSLCCHTTWDESVTRIPSHPQDLYFWETSIDVLGIRQLPTEEWVLLLAGNNDALYPKPEYIIGDYYPQDYYNNTPRPERTKSRYMSNQGGWMGTRHQIVEWHTHWCHGGFLPPFLAPYHKYDGLHLQTVEYWSGGGQLVGPHACHLQRVIPLEPAEFSRSLLYHTSNNKQRSPNVRHKFSSRTIDEFWAQLNTIRQRAIRVMEGKEERTV